VQGAGEHWVIPVQVTNVSAVGCLITGTPELAFVDAAGQVVGLPVVESRGGARTPEYELHPGQKATAELWEWVAGAAAANGMQCAPTAMADIRLTWPVNAVVAGSQGAWQAATQVCTAGDLRPAIEPFVVSP
jgi:hypothetical protein